MKINETNENMEEYDGKSQTEYFNPVNEEKKRVSIPVSKPVEKSYYYEDDDEDDYEDEEKSKNSSVNGILIGVVVILIVLFIFVVIWGVSVFKEINKKEDNSLKTNEDVVEKETEAEKTEQIEKEENPENTETEKIECYINFDSASVYKTDEAYIVEASLILKDNTERKMEVYIDENTKIEEDGYSLLYVSFVNYRIKKIGNREVLFKSVIDEKTCHVDYINYKSEILPKEPEEYDEEGFETDDGEEGFVIQ